MQRRGAAPVDPAEKSNDAPKQSSVDSTYTQAHHQALHSTNSQKAHYETFDPTIHASDNPANPANPTHSTNLSAHNPRPASAGPLVALARLKNNHPKPVDSLNRQGQKTLTDDNPGGGQYHPDY